MTPRIALYVFLAWVAIQLALLVASHLDNSVIPTMRAAVAKVATSESEIEKEEMAKGFAWISLVWFALTMTVAAFAFVSAADRSIWGTVIFVIVGAWCLYEGASSPIVLGRMYPGLVGWQDWIVAIVGSLVWLYLFVVVAARWLNRAA